MPTDDVPNVVTLRANLTRNSPLPLGRAVAIVSQVAREVDGRRAGGGVGVVTPAAIMVNPDGVAWLTDSAVAGESMGYLAPERPSADGPATVGADVYALACVLYECLTGDLPTPREPEAGGLAPSSPLASAVNPAVPHELAEVIARGLAGDQAARYGSAGDFAHAARVASMLTYLDPAAPPSFPQPASDGPPIYTYDGSVTNGSPMHVPPGASSVAVPPRAPRQEDRHRTVLIGVASVAALVLASVVALVTALFAGVNIGPLHVPRGSPARTAVEQPAVQILPFHDIPGPSGIAVDHRGNVYVMSSVGISVVDDGTGYARQIFPSLSLLSGNRGGLAVDTAGDLYLVSPSSRGRQWIRKLSPRTGDEFDLPFPVFREVGGIAVDSTDAVYITDYANQGDPPGPTKVLKLAPGATDTIELPFPNLESPMGIAVDDAGAVYVLARAAPVAPDGRELAAVWKLAAGASAAQPVPGLDAIEMTNGFPSQQIAVDRAGNIVVTTGSRVLRAKPGDTRPTELPLEAPGVDIYQVASVAVDGTGNVYAVGPGDESGFAVRLKVP